MPNIKQHLTRLDIIVDNVFIPAITDGRFLLSLPAKGGLGIPIFSAVADIEFANSRAATEQLIVHISNQYSTAPMDSEQLKTARRRIVNTREELNNSTLQQLHEKMSPEQLRANDLAKMRGASSWLTTLPLKSENFDLREFYDALSFRYHWTPKCLPSTCPCGKRIDVDHAMSCMKSGFVHRRHDDVQDLFASLLKDVCHDAEVEPHLKHFFMPGILTHLQSHLNQKLDTAFSSNENEKKPHYNQRIIKVEHGSFSPLVFSSYGGNGRDGERFLTELAHVIRSRWIIAL